MSTKKTERADVAVEMMQLAESRTKAQRLIMAGEIWLKDHRIAKAAEPIRLEDIANLEHRQLRQGYVGRGAEKLEPILTSAKWQLPGTHCMDVGASTGGFTEVLLKYGAAQVTAIDVGYGQLHQKLREDSRVLVRERLNFRYWDTTVELERFDYAVMDVSFISVRLLLQPLIASLKPQGRALVLVKPQFEVGKEAVPRGGVIRDQALIERMLADVQQAAGEVGFVFLGYFPAGIKGRKGNQEWFLHVENNLH